MYLVNPWCQLRQPKISLVAKAEATTSISKVYNFDGNIEITPVLVPILLLRNLPPYFGVQMDLLWDGSKTDGYNVWIGETCLFVRSQQHDSVRG